MSGNAWIIIGVIAAAIAAFSIPYGFHKKSKDQVAQSKPLEKQEINVGGDYVEGNKIINMTPSNEELETIVRKVAKEYEQSLSNKYSEGHIVFGLTKDGFVVPKGLVPNGVDVYWNTGNVITISEDIIKVTIPSMMINTDGAKNVKVSNNTVTLSKQINGRAISLMTFGDVGIQIEVLGIDKELIVVGLGLISRGSS